MDAIYAVGDVHGRLDLLERIEAAAVGDARACGFSTALILCLGDIIDRGPKSAHVMDWLCAKPPAGWRRATLLGNHEEMLLDFWEDPKANAAWLAHGGAETLASYGVYLTERDAVRRHSSELRRSLSASIPRAHLDALRAAPRAARAGAWHFTHAGLDPSRGMGDQNRASVTWGAAGDLTEPDGPNVSERLVFGHFHGASARSRATVFCLDTHAHETGRLAALRVTPFQPASQPRTLTVTI